MKVYVLLGYYGYDIGKVLMGVYKNYEEADMAGKDFFEKKKEEYVIEEVEIGALWYERF